MIQSLVGARIANSLLVCACTAILLGQVRIAQARDEAGDTLPLTPVDARAVESTVAAGVVTILRWEGEEYAAAEGSDVLMHVIIDPATDPHLRASALEALSRLRNADTTPQLISLYQDLREREEKTGVIRCLTWSGDPRGLPLFGRVLGNEMDPVVRLFAAAGLSNWNVRKGVAELVALLESEAALATSAQRPALRDNALDLFLSYNHRKDWGFPHEQIQKEISARTDLTDDEKWLLAISTIRKWFAENEHRFPNWKLGDPLPDLPKQKPSSQDNK